MEREWQAAVETGDATAVERLLERGCDPDSKDRYGQTALMLAALHGHLEVAATLVRAGANLDHTAKYHLSALMLAVINRRVAIAELLVNAGADTRLEGTGAPGFAGKTALDLAEDLGRPELAELLRKQPPR